MTNTNRYRIEDEDGWAMVDAAGDPVPSWEAEPIADRHLLHDLAAVIEANRNGESPTLTLQARWARQQLGEAMLRALLPTGARALRAEADAVVLVHTLMSALRALDHLEAHV